MKKQITTTKRLGFLALGAILAVSALFLTVTPVMADTPVSHTITLLSGGTTQTAGYTNTNPFPDQLNPALYTGGGTWFSAPVITDHLEGIWVQATSGAQWVSTTADYSGVDNDDTGDGWRLYKDSFSIPDGATITSASIEIAADNAYEIYLNGNLIATTDDWDPVATVYGVSPEPGGTMLPFQTLTTYPINGANTLMIVVRNWDNLGSWNPTGLLYTVSVTYETSAPPTTTTPPTTTATPTTPVAVGGTVYPIDKLQLLLPWLGLGLGGLLILTFTVNRFVVRKK
jgi:hypothetical protein